MSHLINSLKSMNRTSNDMQIDVSFPFKFHPIIDIFSFVFNRQTFYDPLGCYRNDLVSDVRSDCFDGHYFDCLLFLRANSAYFRLLFAFFYKTWVNGRESCGWGLEKCRTKECRNFFKLTFFKWKIFKKSYSFIVGLIRFDLLKRKLLDNFLFIKAFCLPKLFVF